MNLPRAKPRRIGLLLAQLPAVVTTLALTALAARGDTNATVRADQQFTSYAYAHEFGSGVYDFDGRTLQVYGLPFAWTFLERSAQNPGLRLTLPVTLGFLDFQAADVIESGLPDGVDSISFVPGIEVEFLVAEHWRLLPYVQVGKSLANEADVETDLFGSGVRLERPFDAGRAAALYAGEVTYSRVDYQGAGLPDDDFLRLRNGLELKCATGLALADRAIEIAWFTTLDYYADPPTGPTTGIDVPDTQLETGIVFGTNPAWRVWKVPLPRIGLSYRFAGDLSTVRLVLGAPF